MYIHVPTCHVKSTCDVVGVVEPGRGTPCSAGEDRGCGFLRWEGLCGCKVLATGQRSGSTPYFVLYDLIFACDSKDKGQQVLELGLGLGLRIVARASG